MQNKGRNVRDLVEGHGWDECRDPESCDGVRRVLPNPESQHHFCWTRGLQHLYPRNRAVCAVFWERLWNWAVPESSTSLDPPHPFPETQHSAGSTGKICV